jgi:hypothetical protein
VFGGGLGLYARVGSADKVLGGLGVSGDTSCAADMIAWRVRKNLGLDHLKGINEVSGDADRPDNIIYDIERPRRARSAWSKRLRSSDLPEHGEPRNAAQGRTIGEFQTGAACGSLTAGGCWSVSSPTIWTGTGRKSNFRGSLPQFKAGPLA